MWKVKCSFQGLFYKSIQLYWSVNVWTGDSLNQIIGWHDIPKLLEGKDTPLLASTVAQIVMKLLYFLEIVLEK